MLGATEASACEPRRQQPWEYYDAGTFEDIAAKSPSFYWLSFAIRIFYWSEEMFRDLFISF